VNLTCSLECGVRSKSRHYRQSRRDEQQRPCPRRMGARSAISYTEMVHRQRCGRNLAPSLERSMRMGVLVEVVLMMMDGNGEEVGVAGRYFEVFAARPPVKGRLG
jgi:hypothetical protein